jgi:hypothetical protein
VSSRVFHAPTWISESDVIGVGYTRAEKDEYADENSTIVRVVQKNILDARALPCINLEKFNNSSPCPAQTRGFVTSVAHGHLRDRDAC